jgi:cbb3-type cytochrome oxidase cytochrome c subunit
MPGSFTFRLDSPFQGPRRVVEPGTLPSYLFTQTEHWIDVQGFQHRIKDMNEEQVKWTLDYLLANARDRREQWAFEQKQTYDVKQKARRWMLDQPVVLAFMRRLVELADLEAQRA